MPTLPASHLPLLRDVSRSFYLSIRLLPAGLRQPIALGYLLARATDTVADTAQLPVADRRNTLTTLAAAIGGDAQAASAVAALGRDFAALQSDGGEQRLILRLQDCLAWLDSLDAADRQDVREVLAKITRGQFLDVERFGGAPAPTALPDAAALDEYTYLVAGCVGEFWTRLCFRHIEGFAALPETTMLELGRSYGMGLQLVNILRDARADLAAGRCYLPQDEVASRGMADVHAHWRGKAAQGLDAGMRYAQAVQGRRVRAASALPALVGARTLSLMRERDALHTHVKMPRAEMRGLLLRLALGLGGRVRLEDLYHRCADGTIRA